MAHLLNSSGYIQGFFGSFFLRRACFVHRGFDGMGEKTCHSFCCSWLHASRIIVDPHLDEDLQQNKMVSHVSSLKFYF